MEFLAMVPDALDNLSQSTIVSSNSLDLAERIALDGFDPPEDETLLPDWGFRFRDYSVDAAAELGIFFGSADVKFMRRLVVYEWQKYRDIQEGVKKIRWGVAIRVRMNVLKKNATASLSTPFNLAAAAQAGLAETTVEIDNLGISSATVEAAIPIFNALTEDSFVKLQHAFTEALPELTRGDDISFTPRVLSVWGDVRDPNDAERGYREALATAWGIDRIERGKRLREALERGDESFKAIVRSVYTDFAKITPDNPEGRPNDVTRAQARLLLNGLSVDD